MGIYCVIQECDWGIMNRQVVGIFPVSSCFYCQIRWRTTRPASRIVEDATSAPELRFVQPRNCEGPQGQSNWQKYQPCFNPKQISLQTLIQQLQHVSIFDHCVFPLYSRNWMKRGNICSLGPKRFHWLPWVSVERVL